MNKLKKNDNVLVIAGKDKGKQGPVADAACRNHRARGADPGRQPHARLQELR
jgi:hypothetical protein